MLREKEGVARLYGLGKERMASVLLHAASFNPNIQGVALDTPMPSFRSIVEMEVYDPAWVEYTVAGALPFYDLPDLLDKLAEDRKVLIIDAGEGKTGLRENYPGVPDGVGVFSEGERGEALKKWLE
jgi:hypothetical protein